MSKKKKKHSGEPSAGSPQNTGNAVNPSTARAGSHGSRRGVVTMVAALSVLLALGAFVTWHRRKDPWRQWARRIEVRHASKIDARLTHCFGGSSGDAIRAIMNDVRRGAWAAPYRSCIGPAYTELIAAPMDFLSDISGEPAAAHDAQTRERGRLERLRGSLQALERAVGGLERTQPVPESARDRVATALEDVAIEVGNEHQSMEDLANAAEDTASAW